MKETSISAKKHIVKYGIILGILWVFYSFINYQTDYKTYRIITGLIEVFIYGCIPIFTIYKYKAINKGLLTLKKALVVGLGVVLIGTFMQIVFDITLYMLIAPDLLDELIGYPEDITTKVEKYKFGRKFDFLLTISIGNIIGNLFLGTIVSALAGAIMHKRSI